MKVYIVPAELVKQLTGMLAKRDAVYGDYLKLNIQIQDLQTTIRKKLGAPKDTEFSTDWCYLVD